MSTTTKTQTSALAELERLERAARDVDAHIGELVHAEAEVLRKVDAAQEAVECYWEGIAAGADPNERELRKLAAEAKRLALRVTPN